jgi:hypothetical protein
VPEVCFFLGLKLAIKWYFCYNNLPAGVVKKLKISNFLFFMRFLVFLLIIFIPLLGCNSNRKAIKAERKAEKVREQQAREAREAYEIGLDRHMSLQTPDTRDRMKQNRKKSEQWLKPKKRDPFYKRWFKKRR